MSEHITEVASVKLGKDCTIYNAASLHKEIENAMQQSPVIEIDVSSVELVDASFIQILAASHVQAKKTERKVNISGYSECLTLFVASIHCNGILDNDTALNVEDIKDET